MTSSSLARSSDSQLTCAARSRVVADLRWPVDYLPWDSGRLRVHPEFAAGFQTRGWTTVSAIMHDENIEVARCVQGRRNSRRDNGRVVVLRESRLTQAPNRVGVGRPGGIEGNAGMPGTDGVTARIDPAHRSDRREWIAAEGDFPEHAGSSDRVLCRETLLYLKRHWRKRGERPGVDEAEAVERCHRAGVPTMELVAAGWRDVPLSSRRMGTESFVMTAEIARPSLFDEVWNWRLEGTFDDPEHQRMLREYTSAIAHTVRQLHQGRLYHQDLYWRHCFLDSPSDLHQGARLIDLQTTITRIGLAGLFYRIKDLEQMRFSMQRLQLPAEVLEFWFATYFGRQPGEAPSAEERWIRALLWLRIARRVIRRWRRGLSNSTRLVR